MILTGLALGTVLGFALQRGRFCVTGAFRDVWLAKQTRWLTAFLVTIAVQAIGIFALDALGVIQLGADTFPWLGAIVGGLVFGFAIVYAGGCATGTYYRAGEGLIGSWIALAGYALAAAIMKHGPGAPLVESLRGVTAPVGTVHELLGVSPWALVALLVAGVGAAAWHHLRKDAARPKPVQLPARRTGIARILFERPWNAFATAVVIGVIGIAAFPLSYAAGRESGLGITTPSADIVAFLVTGDAELVDWGVMLVLGILLGSFIAAKGSGEFRIRVPDAQTVLRSTGGGLLMGVGAAIAGGCTIGNAMVGSASFTLQGWTAFAAMLLGTGIAVRVVFGRRGSRAAPAPTPVGV
ncbi:YeeE/YedE family protein [Agrococcus baldri]|uniref:Sulfur transporter n=1 Tax=Agrococcus baldri TaxID=153730 RepID=A0AA87RAJ6_9MICO|nr:YeeE/YedE family protein [Agrococcus baldri]GEK79311.1 sulfur transporter [Agrococcus baldri]